ncbi:hypothetical protein RFI_29737, partial [Reticulomyxa filosa]
MNGNADQEIASGDDNTLKLAMEAHNRFRKLFNGSRNDFPRWRRQFLAWKATYQLTDKFCHRYMLSQCLSLEVQEMAAAEEHKSFGELMNWMCKMFGGKHQIEDRTSDLVQFITRPGEEPLDILLRWRQAKFALKLELDYASECDVPSRKRLKPSDERLMEALLDSLSGIVRRLVYDRDPTTLEETEEALEFVQHRYEEEIRSRSKHLTLKRGNFRFTVKKAERNHRSVPYQWKDKQSTDIDLQHQNHNVSMDKGPRSKTNLTDNASKRQWNDECWRCGGHGHKKRDCREKQEIQTLEKQATNDANIEHILPMLVIDNAIETQDEIEIVLQTIEIGDIKAIADTGSSICAINERIANQFRQLLSKDSRACDIAHAGGRTTVSEKLELTLSNPGSKDMNGFKEHFYVVPNLPFNFILSRNTLRRLGYALRLEHEKLDQIQSEDILEAQGLEHTAALYSEAVSIKSKCLTKFVDPYATTSEHSIQKVSHASRSQKMHIANENNESETFAEQERPSFEQLDQPDMSLKQADPSPSLDTIDKSPSLLNIIDKSHRPWEPLHNVDEVASVDRKKTKDNINIHNIEI